jgi:hypothetical protein
MLRHSRTGDWIKYKRKDVKREEMSGRTVSLARLKIYSVMVTAEISAPSVTIFDVFKRVD